MKITQIRSAGRYPPLSTARLAELAVPARRLYPTVKEEREKRVAQKRFNLHRTSIGKGGGLPS